MSPSPLDECFARFRHSAARLETLPAYAVPGEAERIAAWREGRPRPERSVRTSEYLREVAGQVLAGRERARVRVVGHPLSEYARYQMTGYVESAAAGEQILIAVRSAAWGAPDLAGDFWLFDRGTPGAAAVLMRYDGAGAFTGSEAASPRQVTACERAWDAAAGRAVPLNEYLAAAGIRLAAA